MSVKVMQWVFENSRSTTGARLVMLAIADCANDEGKHAYPSMAALEQKTRMTDRQLRRLVAELVRMGELRVDFNGGPRGTNLYEIVMESPDLDSEPSTPTPDKLSPRTNCPPGQIVRGPRTICPSTPEKLSTGTVIEPSRTVRENLTLATPPPTPPDDDPRLPAIRAEITRLCEHLADRIEANGSKRPAVTAKWMSAARLMIDSDGRTEEQIHAAIDWCQADEFWRGNILSMPKLRARYDQLRLAAQRQRTAARLPSTDVAIPANGGTLPDQRDTLTGRDRKYAETMALAAQLRAQETAA